ncbi:MAG: YciI family protein [Melioribacteraceae bacterium]
MQFLVIAHDAKDENALERRLAVREEHLKFASKMFESGKWLFASALLDKNDNMNGSVIACDYSSEEELKKEWLDNEAYVVGNVWTDITIRKAKIATH